MLGEIRSRILEQVDWKPTQAAAFVSLLTRMVNRAQQALFQDAPFLLEQEVRFITQPDVVSSATNTGGITLDRLAVHPTNPRVMRRSGLAASPDWMFDGTWDGRWVEIVNPSGVTVRRQTREWWQEKSLAGGADYDCFTIETPWPNNTDAGMTYRITTPEYHLPADAVEIKSARIWADSNHLLRVAMQGEMERGQLLDFRGRSVGIPELIYKGKPYQLQAPTLAPVAAAYTQETGSAWVGPDNAGSWDFCYTNCWGNIDDDVMTPVNGLSEVRWESGPSPISAKAVTTNNGRAIKITLPDADFEMGFNFTGDVAAMRSGLRRRLYARRYTADQGAGITRAIESPEVFMLLDEVAGHTQEYAYDGSKLADYLRRLKQINGYQSVRLYPVPDARYEVDCRVQFRPSPLVNAMDAPRINDDGIDALVQKALVYFYQHDGKPELAMMAEAEYQNLLRTLTKRYATISYGTVRKQPARVGRGTVGMRSRAARYDEPT